MVMNLESYRGKMGRLSDAGALLRAIDGSGREMRLPNIVLAPNSTTTLNLDNYLGSTAQSAEVANLSIATVELNGNRLTIIAKSEGQTSLEVVCADGKTHYATITVREGANDNGWL